MAPQKYCKLAAMTLLVTMATVYCVWRFSVLDMGKPPSLPSLIPRKSVLAMDDKMNLLEEFDNRREHVQQECQSRGQVYYSTEPQVSPEQFLLDDQRLFLFCYIPKNGCSFWKRVFSIIDGRNKDKTVFNLSSVAIHYSGSFGTMGGARKSLLAMYRFLRASKKVMFVRDPYERLFSGYVDKLLSPCAFNPVKQEVINHFRRSRQEVKCPREITFTEFLRYVTSEEIFQVNQHFRRQYTFCYPCHVDYDFIGKLETFHQDADFILRHVLHLDPSQVFGSEQTFEESSDVNIMTDVIGRTWKFCGRDRCVSPFNKMLRLWTVFQVRGFLSVRDPLPVSRQAASDTTQQRFLSLVLAAYRRAGPRAAVRQQRQQALQEAFRSVPRDVLAKVERYVHNDCRLFGYNCSLAARFHLHSPAPPPVFRIDQVLLAD